MYGMGAGLGTDYRIDCNTGLTIDCDAWSNLFNGTCWGMCSASSLPAGVAVGTAPAAPTTSCSSTFITGVCDWMLLAGVGGIGLLLFMGMRR